MYQNAMTLKILLSKILMQESCINVKLKKIIRISETERDTCYYF